MHLSLTALRARHRRFLLCLAIGFLASLAAMFAMSLGYFFDLQAKALAAYFLLGGQQRAPEIVLVAVDEAAFRRLNERQPLSRRYLAGVVRGLRKSGARLIVLDIDLRRPTVPADDRTLAAAIRGLPADPAGPVVVARTLNRTRTEGGETRYSLVPLFDAALEAVSGFSEVATDDDGLLRRIPLTVSLADGSVAGSLALVALARLGGLDPKTFARALSGPEPVELVLPLWDQARGQTRGTSPLRFSRDDDWKINFIGRAGSFLTIASDAVHALGVSGQPPARDNPFRDRIAIVGASFAESRDAFPTPHGRMYGMEIHANILHTLLTRTQIRPFSWAPSLLLQFALCVVIAGLFAVMGANWALVLSLGFAGLVLFGANVLAPGRGAYWYDFLTPILAIRLASKLHDVTERKRIRQAVQQHIGQETADRIYRDEPQLPDGCGTATVLVVKLRGVGALSEALSPARLAEGLGQYISLIDQTVERHRGLVVDWLGDVVLATYGLAGDGAEHSLHAVRTALDLQAELSLLNAQRTVEGLPAAQMGIGIHAGNVFAGSIGSSGKKKRTVVGDAVTVATAIAGLSDESRTAVLITQDAYETVSGHVAGVPRGAIPLDGRREPVTVYEIHALAEADRTL